MYGIQRAELLPTVNATGSAIKQRIPANVEGFPEPMTIENYGVNLGVASWEIDFFGRIRSLKNEALENYLATEQARCSAQILLISSVADAYLTLAALPPRGVDVVTRLHPGRNFDRRHAQRTA